MTESCESRRSTKEDEMRRSTALCMVAYLAFSTPVHAQEAPADRRTPGASSTMAPRTRAALLLELQTKDAPRPESSLVTSAIRAASRLEHQPTTSGRSGRRRQRVFGGLALLAFSGFAMLKSAAAGADYRDESTALFWFGIALGVAGGVMIARADSTSPINIRDGGRTEWPAALQHGAGRSRTQKPLNPSVVPAPLVRSSNSTEASPGEMIP